MKTNKELLEQEYLNANELMQIIPVNYIIALGYIKDIQEKIKTKSSINKVN